MTEPLLLARPFPQREEGPQGYLLRLAEANFLTIRDLEELNVSFDLSCLQRNQLMPELALDPELHGHVKRIAAQADKVGRSWNRQQARWCVHCLGELPIWQASWELLFHDACPRHAVWLVDRCSSCGSQVRWNRQHLLRCPCGADLRAEVSRACPDSVARLSAILAASLLAKPLDDAFEIPVLRGMSVVDIQRLIRFLGSYLDPAAGNRPLKRYRAGRMDVSWPVTSIAAEILQGWPFAFHTSLSRLPESAQGEKPRLGGFFHRISHYLYRGLRGQAFDPIRLTFELWLTEHWKGGLNRRNRRLPAELLAHVQWIPGNVAAERLGIPMNRLRNLIREGLLDGEEWLGTKGRRFLIVRRDQLDQISIQIASEMTMSEAMEVLGIGKVRMQRVLRLLFPTARRTNDKAYLPWCIPRGEVEVLLSIAGHLPMVTIPDEDQVSFAHVLRYWNWNGDEIVALVEAVKSGTMAPVALLDSVRGIGRWVFESARLRAWGLGQNQSRANWVSIPELGKILEVKQQVAYWLTQNGLIQAERLGALKGVGSRVRRSDIDLFRQNYIFGREIAAILGRSPRKVMMMLSEHGIYPVRGHSAEPCRQLVYSRKDEIQRFFSLVTGSPPASFKLVSSLGPGDSSE